MSHALICYDCGLPRHKMAQPVQAKLTKDRKVSKTVTYLAGSVITIGWRCVKCIRKHVVGGTHSPAEEGKGWRRRLHEFIEEMKKRQTLAKTVKNTGPVVIRQQGLRGA
jgi:hypothetical protein